MPEYTAISSDIKEINYREEWALALMQRGVIVDLKVSRWQGITKLDAEELGLTYQDEETVNFMKKYIKLGSEKLIPPEIDKEIKIIESRARSCLKSYTYDTLWGRFLPYSAWQSWCDENEIIRQEFLTAMKVFNEKYDDIVKIIRENYKNLAKGAWRKIYPHDDKEPSVAFLEDFTSKIISKIPTPEKIISSAKYEVNYFTIPLPSFIQEDLLKSEKIFNERILEDYKTLINRDLLETEKEAKRKIIEEFNAKKRDNIDAFLNSTVIALRTHVSDLCDKIIASIKLNKKEAINTSNICKIKSIIENFKILDFYNDKEINDMLKELNLEISKYKGEISKTVVLKKLQHLSDMSSKQIMNEDFNPTIEFIDL